MKAVVFSLGCKVNECESQSLMTGLTSMGYEVSEDLEPADIYIVNTCAVTKEAEKKSRQMASRIRHVKKDAKIIFMGCASEKCPSAFAKKGDNFLVIGTFGRDKILKMLDNCGERLFDKSTEYEDLPYAKNIRARAFIKVQDGCDNFCSYCIIPYLRGRSRSRSVESILSEIESVESKEIVLTGIDLSDYNYNGIDLSGLIDKLCDCDKRIRLGSLETRIISDKFLTSLKLLKNFAPHFHLSLQSGSNSVLKKMNRKYTREEFIDKVDLIRKYFPCAGITTDIIAGFPNETEEDFNDTLDLVNRVKFSDIHPFIFSPREGTVAYKMKDLPFDVKKKRLDELLKIKEELKEEFAIKNRGEIMSVLLEENKDGYSVGYTGNYLRVYVKGSTYGHICNVKILKPLRDGVEGEII